jgi:essential nuclear protein 1
VAQPKRRKAPKAQARDEEDLLEEVLPEKVSRAILKAAKEQHEEEAPEEEMDEEEDDDLEVEQDGEDPEVDADGFVFADAITAEEERALALFMGQSEPKGRNLADIIMEKLEAKEQQEAAPVPAGLSPKVVKVYSDIGEWMRRFKSGKMPKALKVVPQLLNWEEVLYLTNPVDWSANAHHEATKLFASNLNQAMAQRFYNLVVLPAVREDIGKNGRLHFHLYQALKKALYKPQAWLRGILLPLAAESCTLREAAILGSVVSKMTIPPLHAAAAMMKLAEMQPWYGSTSVLLTAFINKKYALPRRVVDTLVAHFHSFVNDERELPVVWHQCLLTFVQRYKLELDDAHKKRLKVVLRSHLHKHMGPEIRREMFAA